MVGSEISPDRGDLVWLSFDPQTGHEQKGRRPAIVLSPKAYNQKVGLALMCPVTNRIKGYPFEVRLPDRCEVLGVVLSDQVKSLDWRARKAEIVCSVSDEIVSEVLGKLRILLTHPEN